MQDTEGKTALQEAVFRDWVKARKAHVDAKDNNWPTPLRVVALEPHSEIINTLLQRTKGEGQRREGTVVFVRIGFHIEVVFE